MKPPNFTSHESLVITFFSIALVLSAALADAAAQNKSQYTLAEYNAFQAQNLEKNATVKIKLLDDFTASFPDSSLTPYAYDAYYETYYSLRDYPHTIVYVDKLLAVFKEVGPDNMRFSALLTRAMAYAADCDDSVLQTPEASAKAQDAAAQGLQLVRQLPTPSGASDEEFASTKARLEMTFNYSAGIAASRLKGEPVVCVQPPPATDPAAIKAGADRFERTIQELSDEQRQSPVR